MRKRMSKACAVEVSWSSRPVPARTDQAAEIMNRHGALEIEEISARHSQYFRTRRSVRKLRFAILRLKLAGAQDKVVVRIEGNEISLPLGHCLMRRALRTKTVIVFGKRRMALAFTGEGRSEAPRAQREGIESFSPHLTVSAFGLSAYNARC